MLCENLMVIQKISQRIKYNFQNNTVTIQHIQNTNAGVHALSRRWKCFFYSFCCSDIVYFAGWLLVHASTHTPVKFIHNTRWFAWRTESVYCCECGHACNILRTRLNPEFAWLCGQRDTKCDSIIMYAPLLYKFNNSHWWVCSARFFFCSQLGVLEKWLL